MMMVLKFKTLDTRLTPNAKEETRSPVFFFFLRRKGTALKIKAVTTLRPHCSNFGYTLPTRKQEQKYCGVLLLNKHVVVVI